MASFVTGGSGFLGRELIRALGERGHAVRALARSPRSEAAVRAAGAEPVAGDLDAVAAMRAGMDGCDLVFHAAAHTEEWDSDDRFHQVNVDGTASVLQAARDAGVRRIVLVSTEAVLAGGPIRDADETTPLPRRTLRGYPATKRMAEELVRAACRDGVDAVIIRPRFLWGRGDTAVLAKLVAAASAGRLRWVDGGRYPTSTCHVANACEGALLAAERGRAGETYFLTDGEPVEFRWFVSELLRTQGVAVPDRGVPRWVARSAAATLEPLWRLLRIASPPPVTRVAVTLMGQPVTVSDAKARRELGYTAPTTIAAGLTEMASQPPVQAALATP